MLCWSSTLQCWVEPAVEHMCAKSLCQRQLEGKLVQSRTDPDRSMHHNKAVFDSMAELLAMCSIACRPVRGLCCLTHMCTQHLHKSSDDCARGRGRPPEGALAQGHGACRLHTSNKLGCVHGCEAPSRVFPHPQPNMMQQVHLQSPPAFFCWGLADAALTTPCNTSFHLTT